MIWLMTSLGFPFASHARHGIEEASDNGHRQKKEGGNKNLISLAKWKKKDNPRRQVLLGHGSCSMVLLQPST